MQTDKGELTVLLKGTGMQETLVKLGNGFLFFATGLLNCAR